MGDSTRALLARIDPKSHAQVRAALERFAAGIALVPAPEEEPADREMVIVDGGGGWTLVIDSSDDLERTALSIDATTVTCALYDGDTTELSLYAGGKRRARVATGENAKTSSHVDRYPESLREPLPGSSGQRIAPQVDTAQVAERRDVAKDGLSPEIAQASEREIERLEPSQEATMLLDQDAKQQIGRAHV